jgi:hypothetical protein
MGYCKFDDDIQVVSGDGVAVLAELIHDLIGPFSLHFVVESRDDMLKGKVAVSLVLEDLPQEGYAVSDGG